LIGVGTILESLDQPIRILPVSQALLITLTSRLKKGVVSIAEVWRVILPGLPCILAMRPRSSSRRMVHWRVANTLRMARVIRASGAVLYTSERGYSATG
jgi:hypothetical protein